MPKTIVKLKSFWRPKVTPTYPTIAEPNLLMQVRRSTGTAALISLTVAVFIGCGLAFWDALDDRPYHGTEACNDVQNQYVDFVKRRHEDVDSEAMFNQCRSR